MYRIGWILIVLGLLAAGPAVAEFYKYVDPDGVVRFTDDPSQIPQSQQKVQKYAEAPPGTAAEAPAEAPSEATEAAPEPSPAAAQTPPTFAGSSPPPADLEAWNQALEKQRQELDGIYKGLSAEMEAIESQRAEAKSKAQVKAYNERIAELNRKIEDYEKQRRDLNDQIKAYNEKTAGTTVKAP